jgi:orotidine-5'-phosphate decarboxylase
MKNEGAGETFSDRLASVVKRRQTPVLVGLDPRFDQLPPATRSGLDEASLDARAAAYTTFCRDVIDVVAPLVPAVKPQMAFFEELGPAGMFALAEVVAYARRSGLLVILDGKRNDIGSTAAAYASAYLGAPPASPWGADALTVSPYLGDDSLEPFVEAAIERAAGVFVLVKTSNPGGGAFQDLRADDLPLYRHVAKHVHALSTRQIGACGYGAVGAVVGATYPEQLAELRAAMPRAWLLVPGYGAQGAGARDVAAAFDAAGLGAIVNSSRAIIFAHARKEFAGRFSANQWQQAVDLATREMIAELRAETPAAKLAH